MDFTNLGTSIFATGMGVTILSKFKDICNFINKYIKIGYSIHTSTDGNMPAYISLYKYIQTLQSKSIQKRLSFDIDDYDITTIGSTTAIAATNVSHKVIGAGTYLVHPKWNQIITITASTEHKQNSNHPNHILTLNIYGRHAKELQQQVSKNIFRDLNNNKQVISDRDTVFETEKRTFSTIYHQNKETIINFLDTFKDNKQRYINNGLAYKTGILLYGPPGTGKTSMIKAIAAYMDYSIQIVNPYQKITAWEIRPNSVIVFEDIDKFLKTKKLESQDDKDDNILSALQPIMQLLDGLYSKDNIIFVATTNHIELLPPELIRSGRFDCKMELSDIPKNIAEEMCKNFEVSLSDVVPENQSYPINPAYLQKLILNKINRI